jgi:hypothetical protein
MRSSFLWVCFGDQGLGSSVVVSHISRKTSEIWGTRLWWEMKGLGVEGGGFRGFIGQ